MYKRKEKEPKLRIWEVEGSKAFNAIFRWRGLVYIGTWVGLEPLTPNPIRDSNGVAIVSNCDPLR
jgi:hypothetical protein